MKSLSKTVEFLRTLHEKRTGTRLDAAYVSAVTRRFRNHKFTANKSSGKLGGGVGPQMKDKSK